MITDEMVEAACKAYHKIGVGAATPYGKELMKAALEAVFANYKIPTKDFASSQAEPEENQGWIECDGGMEILTKEDNGTIRSQGWLPNYATHYRIRPITVKPEKKTFWDMWVKANPIGDNSQHQKNRVADMQLISEYMDNK